MSDDRLDRQIDRLPGFLARAVHWMRRPESKWVRIPVGVLFIIGSFLSILPVFGLWMLPLGMLLLAQDIPFIGRLLDKLLDWIERRHPQWLGDK